MHYKKIGKLLLVTTMCAALAAGCGKKGNEEDALNNQQGQEDISNEITNPPEEGTGGNDLKVPEEDSSKEEDPADQEQEDGTEDKNQGEGEQEEEKQEEGEQGEEKQEEGNTEETKETGAKLYMYGWNGSGVDFSETDIRGWDDKDTASPLTDASGNSMYHTDDNFGSDAYLVFDFGGGKEIGAIRLATPNENILADSWAVYAGNQMDNAESSWDVLGVSSEMALVDGVIEIPVNGTYRYVMIGGYNAEEFMNAWVHAWDYLTEITFTE